MQYFYIEKFVNNTWKKIYVSNNIHKTKKAFEKIILNYHSDANNFRIFDGSKRHYLGSI